MNKPNHSLLEAKILEVRKLGLKITKNAFPSYSRQGTRAAGKTYDLPMHNLKPVEGEE
jgi:hypothetical protein